MTATMQLDHQTGPASTGRRGPSMWLWFMLAAGAAFWASVGRPLRDPDIWWHVRTGELILDSGIPRTEPWAFSARGNTWVPTAWLSDVVLALAHSAAGWWAIVALKLLFSAVLLVLLARELLRCGPPRIAAGVLPLTLVVLAPFLGERPQLVSFIFTVWLTGVVRRLFTEHRLHWSFLPLVYLWANLHGMWVLAPLAMGVATVGLTLDRSPGWRRAAGRAAGAACLSVALAAVTPVGPKLAYWSLVVRDAARDISEWQATRFTGYSGMALLAIFAVWATAVARSDRRAPRSEILWMISVLVFSTQAGRNVAPASILMAPFAVQAASRAWAASLSRFPEPRVHRAMIPLTVLAALVGAVAFAASSGGPIAPGLPDRIVAELKSRPGTVRVLNSYNIGGYLTGMGAPKISVAIDGRTDNYDAEYVHRYLAETSGLADPTQLIKRLNPDVAVLGRGSTLADELERRGWQQAIVDGDYVLLDRPRQGER